MLCVEEGVLYPALHRLERDGLLSSEWGVNDTGRRAKFYSLTERGRKQLAAEVEDWRRSSSARISSPHAGQRTFASGSGAAVLSTRRGRGATPSSFALFSVYPKLPICGSE